MVAETSLLSRALGLYLASMSGIAAGGALCLVVVHLRDWKHGVEESGPYILARVGFVIVVGLVGLLIAGMLQKIDVTWKSWLYGIGLTLAGIGYVWLLARSLRVGRRAERRRSEKAMDNLHGMG